MEIWLDKGMTLVYANRYEEAEKMLRGVVSIAQKYNDINSQGTAWNNLGICYGQQRKSFPAIEAYDRAIALYQQTGYKLGSAMASGNLSEIYLSRGQLDKALELSRQCQKLGEESEDVISIALGQDIEGRALAELEEFSAAAACFEKSFHTFRQVDDVVSQAMCGCHLVLCLINSGRIEAAGEFILRLEKLFSEEPGLDRDMLNTKAALLAAGGSPGQARQLLEEALADKKNRDRDMSPVLLHLGQLYSRQGDLHRAGEMMAIMQNLPGDQLTNLFKVKMHSAGWSLWSGCGEAEKAREQKNKGLALLEEMAGSYTDRGIWEKYCRKKEVRALLE
jgi:tetratricopeptide (TPR) repeat protein